MATSNVQTLIDDAKTRVADFVKDVDSAQSAVTNAIGLWANSGPEQVDLLPQGANPPTLKPPESVLSSIILPEFNPNITLKLPTPELGAIEAFQNITPLNKGGLPTFTKNAPIVDLNTISKPSQLDEFKGAPPPIDLSKYIFPTVPSYLSAYPGGPPDVLDRSIPVAPETIIPVFTGTMPTDAPTAPADLISKFTTAYADASPSLIAAMNGYIDAELAKINPQYSAQMAAIEAQLTKYLAGGTGLNAAAENAIYERARSKNNAEALRVRSAAFDEAASRGFTIPTGALMSALQTARQAGADNNAKAAAEIVVMQAEMEQKNLQFAVTTSAGIRQAAVMATMAYVGHILTANGQALDYAKSVLNSMIQVYNLQVETFRARLDAYKAEAQVYEARMKGAMMGVELYKTEIEAIVALTNVDRARIEAYKAKMEAYSILSNAYKIQVDSVIGKANLEKLAVDVYQAKVQAFGARVQAKNSEWMGYQAQIEGKLAEYKGFQAEVEGFKAKSESYNTFLDAQAKSNQAESAANSARAMSFEAKAKAYTIHLEANKSKMEGEFQLERNKLTAFQGQVELAKAVSEEGLKYYTTYYQVLSDSAKIKVEFQKMKLDSVKDIRATQSHSLVADMQVYGQLASSAMAGLNTLASEVKYE